MPFENELITHSQPQLPGLSEHSSSILHTINAIEAAIDAAVEPIKHPTIPVQRRWDELWEIGLDTAKPPKVAKAASFSELYESTVYPEDDIQEIYNSRTGQKVDEIQPGDLGVGDIFEIFFQVPYKDDYRMVSLVIKVTMLNRTGLYWAVYGRPIYTGSKDEFYKKTKDQAKIPCPIYGRNSSVLRGSRNFSTTFCRWINTPHVMERDIQYIILRKAPLAEKLTKRIKGLFSKTV